MHFSTQEQFQEDLAKIPPYDIYKQNLNELFIQDKSSLTQAEITQLYLKKAVLIPHVFADMDNSVLNNLTAFRGRIVDKKEDTTLVNTFSYPHPSICKKNGRANIVEKPVFYCADNPLTAILESKPQVGSVIFLSVWKVSCNRKIQYTSFISPDIKSSNPWYKHGQYVLDSLIKQANKFGQSKKDELKLLFEFNSEIFIREEENYSLTSWLANQNLYRIDGIDFIVYPSITSDTYTCNMAFHPNFVDNYFKFDRVYRIRFNGINNEEINLSVGNVGKINRTHIEWGDLQDEDFNILPHMAKKIKQLLPQL